MHSHAQQITGSPSQVLVVYGPAGGVGKTTLALCLAYLYAAKGVQTVLMDLSQYGTIAPWLRLPQGTGSGLISLLAAGQEQDAVGDLVPAPDSDNYLHLVPSSGPARMDRLSAAGVEAAIQHLSRAAQVVIVDTGSELTERALGAVMSATHVALTLAPSVMAGWQGLDFLEILRSLYIPRERMGLVFSRVRRGSPYGLDEYEQALGLPVWGIIPETARLHAAFDKGGPPNVSTNRGGLWAMRRLAQQFMPIFHSEELKQPWPWRR